MAWRQVAWLLVCVPLMGCGVHWGSGELKQAPPLSKRPASHAGDLQLELERMLAVVERRLARAPVEDADARSALRRERLRIVVALVTLARDIEGSREPASDVDVDALLMDADERIETAERPAASNERERARGIRFGARTKKTGAAVASAGRAGPARDGSDAGEDKDEDETRIGDELKKKRKTERTKGRGGRFDDADDPLGGLLPAPGGAAPKPDAKPTPQAAVVVDQGPPPDVWPEIERRLDEVTACLTPAQRDMGVSLEARARIAADGRFRRVRIRAQPELPADAIGCVADVLRRVSVPATGVSRVVKIPLSAKLLAQGG